jgi:hypothetical protein
MTLFAVAGFMLAASAVGVPLGVAWFAAGVTLLLQPATSGLHVAHPLTCPNPRKDVDMSETTTHVYLTPIAADRADDFDRFLREVVIPAVDARRPDLSRRWRALRPSAPDGDAVTYVFLFDGGDVETDWDLGPLFEEHYGEEQAARHFQTWVDLAVPVRRWAEGLTEKADTGQVGWTCSSVSMSSA